MKPAVPGQLQRGLKPAPPQRARGAKHHIGRARTSPTGQTQIPKTIPVDVPTAATWLKLPVVSPLNTNHPCSSSWSADKLTAVLPVRPYTTYALLGVPNHEPTHPQAHRRSNHPSWKCQSPSIHCTQTVDHKTTLPAASGGDVNAVADTSRLAVVSDTVATVTAISRCPRSLPDRPAVQTRAA